MSILTDVLPDYIEIDGKRFPIRSDFKTWIRVSAVIFGGEDEVIKTAKILSLVFPKLPDRLDSAMQAVIDFYQPRRQSAVGDDMPARRIYDYEHDAEMIYAAFLQQYGMNLNAIDLHWWQFRAMFDNLNDSTQFIKVVGYRAVNLSEIKDKEQKKYYSKMKHIYKLPDFQSEEEKERVMNDMFAKMFRGD